MGDSADPPAVTDSCCRVLGVEGLRVVDASIFPTPMTGGTNLPVIMAAEKAADIVLKDRTVAPLGTALQT
jgi:choline dehydrogenase-like flavoprotein